MTCNEARRLITAYVKKELPDRELEQFLYHVEHCRHGCMDELGYVLYGISGAGSAGFRRPVTIYDFPKYARRSEESGRQKKGSCAEKLPGYCLAFW